MNNEKQENQSADKLILPKDSVDFVNTLTNSATGVNNVLVINPYLSHNRFYCQQKNKKWQSEKSSLLFQKLNNKAVCESEFCCDKKNESGELQKISGMLNERNRIIADSFPGRNRTYIFLLKRKLICGMGGNSPYSNIQLCRLHHVFGIPYIPASAIKGSLRNYIILEHFSGDEEKAEETEWFRELFGTKINGMQTEGKFVFLDAFPSRFELGLDVQTPHFKKYYEGKKLDPRDDEHPVPIMFTCLQNAEFQIYVYCREYEIWEKHEETLNKAMKGVLEEYGIGAKTSLGYGTGMLVDESFTPTS